MTQALDEMVSALRKFGEGDSFAKRVATEAAPKIEEASRATANAGTSPDGSPWAPRKEDGGRAMANAASHVTAKPLGAKVRITLRGPDVWHHFAAGKSEPKRQVIPDGPLPDNLVEVMTKAGAKVFDEIVKGGK